METDSSQNSKKISPVVLILLDGWGIAPLGIANAFTDSKWPNLKEYLQQYPLAALAATNHPDYPAKEAYSQIGSGQDSQAIPGLGEVAKQTGLTELLDQAGLRQAYIAETEKFPLLADYLAEGFRSPKIKYHLISTPLNNDYLKQPLAASQQVIERALHYWHEDRPDFLVISLAAWSSTALYGTGEATVRAINLLDKLLPKLIEPLQQSGATILLTSAYGRLENLIDPLTEQKKYGPSNNPIPLAIIGRLWQGQSLGEGEIFADDLISLPISGSLMSIAPTVLTLLGVERPNYLEDPLLPSGI